MYEENFDACEVVLQSSWNWNKIYSNMLDFRRNGIFSPPSSLPVTRQFNPSYVSLFV